MYAVLQYRNEYPYSTCSYRVTSNHLDKEKERLVEVYNVNNSVSGTYSSISNLEQILSQQRPSDIKIVLVSPLNIFNLREAECLKLVFQKEKCKMVIICGIPNNEQGIKYQNAFRETPNSCTLL